MECAVQVVEVYDVQLEALSNVRPIQDGVVELFLKNKHRHGHKQESSNENEAPDILDVALWLQNMIIRMRMNGSDT